MPARAHPSPLTVVALLLVVGGVLAGLADRDERAGRDEKAGAAGCEVEPCEATSDSLTPPQPPPSLGAASICGDAGYLCAPMTDSDRMRVERWHPLEGPLVVHVPAPDFEDAEVARQLQQAAMNGIRAWNNEPFPILIDLRGERGPHVTIRWRSTLGGVQIGVARTRWSSVDGLSVEAIELATRNPRRTDQTIDPNQVRLTAAHEMGHALGLPHSDSPRDVMYPSNTATSVSARDRRTMEVLYELADGSLIVR